MITIPVPPSVRIAQAALGGPVRQIDSNWSLGETTYALASEAKGYPKDWPKNMKTFTVRDN